MSEADFRALYDRMRAMVPWGPNDRRGALNYLTADKVRAAAAEVGQGRAVSLAAHIGQRITPDNPDPARHEMTSLPGQHGEPGAPADSGLAFAADRISMNIHGDHDSHIDALCHVAYDGHLYNGVAAADALSEAGATELSIDVAGSGITGRGVLLDVPRARGSDTGWLEPGDHVTADDLILAEEQQNVTVGEGDLAFIRVGHRRRRRERGPWNTAAERAGLHPGAVEFLARRHIALLGSDGNNDTAPSLVDGVDFPVHILAVNALGLHILDYLEFDDLVRVCEQTARWSFLTVIAPLRLASGTGSPINPIAIIAVTHRG